MRRKLSGSVFSSSQHFPDCSGEVIHAGARNNNGVAPPVCLFGDTQKFPAIVLAELDMEMLALDLEFLGVDDVVHLKDRSLVNMIGGMKEESEGGLTNDLSDFRRFER